MKKRFKEEMSNRWILWLLVGTLILSSKGSFVFGASINPRNISSIVELSSSTPAPATSTPSTTLTLPTSSTNSSPPYPCSNGSSWTVAEPSSFKNELSYVWKQVIETLHPTHNLRIGIVHQAWSHSSSKSNSTKSEAEEDSGGFAICGYFDLIQTKCKIHDANTSECDVPDRAKTRRCSALVHRKFKSILKRIDCNTVPIIRKTTTTATIVPTMRTTKSPK